MSAATKNLLSISHVIKILEFPGNGVGYSLAVIPSISSYSHLGSGKGGRCGLLNFSKTWKTTRMNIARPILACLKETFFLPVFSRTCTAQSKAVMVKKKLMLLQNSWIMNQVGPGGGKYCNKVAPTYKSAV